MNSNEYKLSLIIVVYPTEVINEYGKRTYIGKQREHTETSD